MSKYTEYITSEGERWDTVAQKAYGDATKYADIIEANPSVSISDVFMAGVRLLVPIIEVTAPSIKELLPPWKRVATTGEQTASASASGFATIIPQDNGSFDGSFD